MGMRGRLQGPAEQLRLGAVRGVHRGRKPWFPELAAYPVTATTLGTLLLYLNDHRRPAFALLLMVAAVWTCYVYASPMRGPGGRCWYAVCDRGLLMRSARLGDTAIPWETITRLDTIRTGHGPVVFRLNWMDNALGAVTTDIGPVTARGDLVRSILAGSPAPARTAGRAVGAVAGAGLLALVLWTVVLPAEDTSSADDPTAGPTSSSGTEPSYSPSMDSVEELPTSPEGFSPVCNNPAGAEFLRAAPRTPRGPHPLVLFQFDKERVFAIPVDLSAEPPAASDPLAPEAADEVQLVACSRQTSLGDLLESCEYTGDITVSHYQGIYRVDVYEARTYRKVGSVTVMGSTDASCTGSIPGSIDHDQQEETGPGSSEYREALAKFASG